jgi:hypothetical protein
MAGGPPLRSVQSWDHRHQRAPFLLAAVRFTYLGSISVSATTYSYSGKHCAISDPSLLTFPIAIAQYSIIAYMQPHPDPVKSLQFKILAINPYYSEILMLSRLQVHCFHRPEGEGVPSTRSAVPRHLAARRHSAWNTHDLELAIG